MQNQQQRSENHLGQLLKDSSKFNFIDNLPFSAQMRQTLLKAVTELPIAALMAAFPTESLLWNLIESLAFHSGWRCITS